MAEVQHKFAIPYGSIDSFVKDLKGKFAETGVSLKTQRDVHVGETVAVEFRFNEAPEKVLAAGEIVWVDELAEGDKTPILIRNLRLTAKSREALRQALQAKAVAMAHSSDTELVEVASPTAPGPQAPQNTHAGQPQVHVQVNSPQAGPPASSPQTHTPPATPEKAGGKGKKILIGVLLFFVLLCGGLALWLFQFGGLQYVLSNHMPAVVAAPLTPVRTMSFGAPPALKAPPAAPKPKPKPKPVPQAKVVDVEYFQGEAYNRFTIHFNRRPQGVKAVKLGSPPRLVLQVRNARDGIGKPQYFLPFTFVKTLQFDQVGKNLDITFLATQSYIPRYDYELDGKQLMILFRPAQ